MANDIVITVLDDAVCTKMRRNPSNLAAGRATLLLLLILLATTAAIPHPDGHTSGFDDDDSRKNVTSQKPNKVKEIPEMDPSDIYIDLVNSVEAQRHRTAKSVLHFQFNERRKRLLTRIELPPNGTKGIVYWMYRDQRVQDNWALLYAQKLAIETKVPLHVVFCTPNSTTDTTLRQYEFLIQGLREVDNDLYDLNINFYFQFGGAVDVLSRFVKNHHIGGIVVDFLPLRDHTSQVQRLARVFNHTLPVIMVDAHNVVPCWIAPMRINASPQKQSVQRNVEIRLKEFLTEFPPLIKHPFSSSEPEAIDWEKTSKNFDIDRYILPVAGTKVGYKEAMLELTDFMQNRLEDYDRDSVNPNVNGLSNLSPWLHFGQISAQRVMLELNRFNRKYPRDPNSFNNFKNQLLIRRELSDNYCYYNLLTYDRIEGAREWAQIALNEHRNDPREYVYTAFQFERAKTHDELWNAAQRQMTEEGKMHRFLRMYWAKKLLEWSDTPENALATAIDLNNRYSLDGHDPNSYVGCMWAVCGVHDRPYKKGHDRPIFGPIRSVDEKWYHETFDTAVYIKKYKPYDYFKEVWSNLL